MSTIKLSPEKIAGLQTVQRQLLDMLSELDKADECGIDCKEYRRIIDEEQNRISKMIEHFGGSKSIR